MLLATNRDGGIYFNDKVSNVEIFMTISFQVHALANVSQEFQAEVLLLSSLPNSSISTLFPFLFLMSLF